MSYPWLGMFNAWRLRAKQDKPQSDDYTLYCAAGLGEDRKDREGQLVIQCGRRRDVGRAIRVSCHRGQQLSYTFRRQANATSYEASTETSDTHPVSARHLCDTLWTVLQPLQSGRQWEGLLLITGATASLKSQVARGLVHAYLETLKQLKRPRRPHIVTFEDPIEAYYHEPRQNLAAKRTVDYTPRERGVDVDELSAATRAALRQTPAVFYVGEVRDTADLLTLADFAVTGHLVVTTFHAGSLVEAMQRYFAAVGANTPLARGQYARRLLAVVHQRAVPLLDTAGTTNTPTIVLPAVWRRTPPGVASLVADGLSSLLPRSYASSASAIGRSYFAAHLADNAKLLEDDTTMLKRRALDLDLGGI